MRCGVVDARNRPDSGELARSGPASGDAESRQGILRDARVVPAGCRAAKKGAGPESQLGARTSHYGLALLRAGEREEGMAQVVEAQKLDRSLPHTYFNLGIEYKKAGEAEKAIDQLLQMERLRPREAKTQYNLGALYKQIGNTRRAIEKFERTIELDPSLAAPHFQLFGIFRRTEPERATQELGIFKGLKGGDRGQGGRGRRRLELFFRTLRPVACNR